jgi:hypothetical protein
MLFFNLLQKFIGVEKSNFVLLTTTKTTEFITFKTFKRLRFDRKCSFIEMKYFSISLKKIWI